MSESQSQADDLDFLQDPAAEFAFVVPMEKFVYKRRGGWNLSEPVGKEGIRNHLLDSGWPPNQVASVLKRRSYLKVYGSDMAPNKDPLYADVDGKMHINTWVPPTLQPVAGEFPRIQRVLEWLTKGDAEGIRWLKHWMAWKVQQPDLVPKVAVVLATQQGGGKGTLAFLMRQMLGEANTAIVKREELGNKFNSRWIGKLFVLGDEVLSNESLRDISNLLKVLIDGNEIEVEGKGKDQRAISNKLAWMFASNDKIAPVVLEKGDRRYSVFTNHDPLPKDYVESLNTSFEADRKTPTPEFAAEIAAFYHELLNTQVDRTFVSRPFQNNHRDNLIDANKPMHELFIEYVEECGLDEVLNAVIQKETYSEINLEKTRHQWEIGDAVAVPVVYRCYSEYCKQAGGKPLKMAKFGTALANAEKPWKYDRLYVPGTRRKIGVYHVPRKPRLEPEVAQ